MRKGSMVFRGLAAVVAVLAFMGVANAHDQTAEEFVKAIYAQYHGTPEKSPGVKLDRPADWERYFEPSLLALIDADEAVAAKNHDVPTLDGDPFIDAQDWDIKDVSVKVDESGRDKATATVKFKNFGEKFTLRLGLVHLAKGWRIYDITYPKNEGTLRGLYVKKK